MVKRDYRKLTVHNLNSHTFKSISDNFNLITSFTCKPQTDRIYQLKVNKSVIELAKKYGKENNISISRMVENYLHAITYYILSQQMKLNNAIKTLGKFKVLVEGLPMDDKVIDLSLESDFKDFKTSKSLF